MSMFNRFCAKVRNAAIKLGDKTEELASEASKAVKIKALEIRIDEQYEKLGALVYRDLHTEDDLEEKKLQVIAVIDGLFDELAMLKTEPETETVSEETAEKETAAPADDTATMEEAPVAEEKPVEAE